MFANCEPWSTCWIINWLCLIYLAVALVGGLVSFTFGGLAEAKKRLRAWATRLKKRF